MRPSSLIASKEVEYDEGVMEEAWTFILEEWDAIKRLARRMSRGDAVLAEDMLSDVPPVYVPSAINCWNPEKSELRGHIMRSLRMYFWKYSNYRHSPGDVALPEDGAPYTGSVARALARVPHQALDVADEVRFILDKLPPYERSILNMYHLADFTHDEMAAVLEVSKGTARVHYQRALQLARDTLSADGYFRDDDGEGAGPHDDAMRCMSIA